MGILPKTTEDWLRLALLPFKAYAAMAYPATSLMYSSMPRHWQDTDAAITIFGGYVWCFVILLFSGMGWWNSGKRREAAITFLFAGVALLFGFESTRFLVAS